MGLEKENQSGFLEAMRRLQFLVAQLMIEVAQKLQGAAKFWTTHESNYVKKLYYQLMRVKLKTVSQTSENTKEKIRCNCC